MNGQEYMNELYDIEYPLTSLGVFGLNLTYLRNETDDYFHFISKKFDTLSEQYKNQEKKYFFDNLKSNYYILQKKVTADITIDDVIKKFLFDKIDEDLIRLDMLFFASTFEKQKELFQFKESNGQYEIFNNSLFTDKKNQNNIDNLQQKIYGNSITDTILERDECLGLMSYKLRINHKRISQEEQEILQNFINKFDDFIENIGKKYINPKGASLGGIIDMKSIMDISEIVRSEFYDDIDWGQEIEEGRNNYSAFFSSKSRKYPDKKTDSLDKIFTVLGHEDGTHMIRGHNHITEGFIIPGRGYEDIEEGLAKLNERLKHSNLDDYIVHPSTTFLSTFVAENCNFLESYKILRIYNKLITDPKKYTDTVEYEKKLSNSALQATQRAKCYCDRNNPGANRKDTIYYRGETLLINSLKELPDDESRLKFYNKLMSLKLSLDDITSGSFDSFINPNSIKNPLVDKIIYQKIKNGYGAFNNIKPGEDGLTNKQRNLEQGDFRILGMEKYTIQQKRTIINILNILK